MLSDPTNLLCEKNVCIRYGLWVVTQAEVDGCPVAALIRARRSLPHCGMKDWYDIMANRKRLWQKLLEDVSPDCNDLVSAQPRRAMHKWLATTTNSNYFCDI